jgi:hypothetical protein
LLKSVEAIGVLDIVMKKPAEVSRRGECVWYSHAKICWSQLKNCVLDCHGKTCWSQLKRRVLDIIMEKPAEVSRGNGYAISNTPTGSTDFSRFFHDYIKHTHRLDWLQQVFPWLYQTHPLPSLEAMGMFDIVMKKPGEVNRGDGCVWYSHGKTCWSQLKRCVLDIVMTNLVKFFEEVCAWNSKNTPLQLTSAVFSMTISNTPTASTDFSRFSHDYQTYPSPRLTSAGFFMIMSSTRLFNWLQQV